MQNILPTKKRNSSVEIFRILSIFLVLIVHFNGWFLTLPETSTALTVSSITQTFITSLSCVCVNCFLIISGFYGIKLKFKSIWDIWITLVFIYVPFYIIECILTKSFNLTSLLNSIIAFNKESYFIQCYLMLMFLSPILNAYIKRYDKNVLPHSIVFVAIAFIFDCLLNNKCLAFGQGYQLTHFVLIYILARTVYLYKDYLLTVKTRYYVIGYFVCTSIIALLHTVGITWAYNYTNPLNITASFCLFIPFLKREFYNKTINYIAKSVFAVYIMHVSYPMIGLIRKYDNLIYSEFNYFTYIPIMLLSVAFIFLFCIIYDKIRIILFNKSTDRIYQYIVSKFGNFSILKDEH